MRRSGLERFVPSHEPGRRKAAITPSAVAPVRPSDPAVVVAVGDAPLGHLA
jgi:hypothetical protein